MFTGPLQAILATRQGSSDLTLSEPVVLSSSALSLSFAAARLDNATAVVAYVDSSSGFGITCQVVRLVEEALSGTAMSSSIGETYIEFRLVFFATNQICM